MWRVSLELNFSGILLWSGAIYQQWATEFQTSTVCGHPELCETTSYQTETGYNINQWSCIYCSVIYIYSGAASIWHYLINTWLCLPSTNTLLIPPLLKESCDCSLLVTPKGNNFILTCRVEVSEHHALMLRLMPCEIQHCTFVSGLSSSESASSSSSLWPWLRAAKMFPPWGTPERLYSACSMWRVRTVEVGSSQWDDGLITFIWADCTIVRFHSEGKYKRSAWNKPQPRFHQAFHVIFHRLRFSWHS